MNTTTNFSWKMAYFLVMCSEIAYKNRSQVKIFSEISRFDDCYFYDEEEDENDTQYFIISNDTDVIVSFRGTKEIRDWVTNLNCDFYDTKICGKLHDGFYQAYREIAENLFYKLEEFRYFNKNLWFTGHSLGAAVTSIAAMNVRLPYAVKGVYTFGSPRVGNSNFKTLYNDMLYEKTFRFVNNNDVVAHLPMKNVPFINYRHVGQMKYFRYDGTVTDTLNCYESIKDKLLGRLQHIGVKGTDGISDHFLNKYKPLIRRQLIEQGEQSGT